MPEIKYFIVYAYWKPEVQGNMDDIKKAMEKWSESVEAAGCKVKFWGAAMGVSENALCVIKGSPENYMKLLPADAPYEKTRTNVVVKF